MKITLYILIVITFIISGCSENSQNKIDKNSTNEVLKTIGSIERIDPLINKIIPEKALIEVLADGFVWSEGPVWIEEGKFVLFSDVPTNKIFKWKEGEGLSLYLKPSGYTGKDNSSEGSNGLLLDFNKNLILCQHGDRRMARMDSPVNLPKSQFITLTDRFNGKRFNSPNDAVYHSNGTIYFTDPPYGLKGQDEDPEKEISFNGVYKTDKKGNTITS